MNSDPPHWTINLCFGAIHTIWVHLRPFGCHRNRGAKRAELVQKFENEVALEFFAPNAPDPPHWTLNLYFSVTHTIWVHLGPFGCHTNLGAKWGELVQKFENEVASEFFAPNAPDPPHWTLNCRFGAFRTIWVFRDCLVALRNSVQNGSN